MFEILWNNWLLIALIPPFLYALVALCDAYFVNNDVFRTAREATIVSSLLGSAPILLPISGSVEFNMPEPGVAAIATLLGVLFAYHGYFYIAALLKRNDTVLAETVQNLSVLCVPLLAFFLLGETLSMTHYFGVSIAGIAVFIMYRVNKPSALSNLTGCGQLMISMILFSLTLVGGDWVYQYTDFWSGLSLFSLGMLVTALVMFLAGEKKRVPVLLCQHWKIFFLVEGITTLGVICSLRAVDVSPSATFVAITECMGAYFILLISFAVFWLHQALGRKPSNVSRVCSLQLDDYPRKMVAGIMISSGIFAVYGW